MHHVIKQSEDYHNNNSNTIVDKLLISVGTNDIRYTNDVVRLKLKLKSLCSNIRDLYPIVPCAIRDTWTDFFQKTNCSNFLARPINCRRCSIQNMDICLNNCQKTVSKDLSEATGEQFRKFVPYCIQKWQFCPTRDKSWISFILSQKV